MTLKGFKGEGMKKYIYFVSYQYQDGIKSGFGNIEITSDKKIKSFEGLIETMAVIKANCKKNNNFSDNFQDCILNFILLKTVNKEVQNDT